jgi:hypothetical protein
MRRTLPVTIHPDFMSKRNVNVRHMAQPKAQTWGLTKGQGLVLGLAISTAMWAGLLGAVQAVMG